jgi:membrane protein YdbS with pleckstrin-like domain
LTDNHQNDHANVPGGVVMKPVTVFPSAVDAWLLIILYAAPVLLAVLGVYLAQANRPDEALTCFMTSIGLVLLNLLLTRPCRYTLTADTLHLRCGVFNETIPLSRIKSAELSSSWLSGPALSLKRVRIDLDKGSRLVSPVHREAFIAQLMVAVDHNRSKD